MRKFPKLLAVVLAVAIVICPAMCLTSMAAEPNGTYAFDANVVASGAYDTATLHIDSETGYLVAVAKAELTGYALSSDEDAVTAVDNNAENLSVESKVSGTTLTILVKRIDVTDLSPITAATISIKVVKDDSTQHYITLTHIQAADQGTVGDNGTLGDENLLTFPCANNNENGLINQVEAAEEGLNVVAGTNCSHDNATTTTVVEPTCTEPGEEKHTCPDCGAEWTTPIDALGHDGVVTSISDTQHAEVCSRCGVTIDGTTADHTFDEKNTCTECGYVKTDVPCDHVWGDPVIVQPTLETKGSKTYTCSLCGDSKVEDIDVISIDNNITATVGSGVSETVYLSYKVDKAKLTNDNYDAFYLEVNKQVKDKDWNLVDGDPQYIRSSDITDNTNRYIIATSSAYWFYFRNIQIYALSVPVYARFYAIKDGITIAASEEIVVTPAVLIQGQYQTNVNNYNSKGQDKYKALATSLADILIASDANVKYQTRNKTTSDFAKLTSPICDFATGEKITFEYCSTDIISELTETNVPYSGTDDVTYGYSTGVSQSPYISAILSNFGDSIEPYSVRFSYYNEVTKKDVVSVAESKDMLPTAKGDKYYAYCYDIAIYSSSSPVTIEVLKDGNVIGTATYCLEAFYAAKWEDATMGNMMKALARLGQSFRYYKTNF